jgi:hypothetical protein
MMSRFAEARQGKGLRQPRTVRQAFLLISAAAVAYSGAFYPCPDVVHGAVKQSRVSRAKNASINEEPIRVRSTHGESGREAEERMVWAVRFVIGIAEGSAHE